MSATAPLSRQALHYRRQAWIRAGCSPEEARQRALDGTPGPTAHAMVPWLTPARRDLLRAVLVCGDGASVRAVAAVYGRRYSATQVALRALAVNGYIARGPANTVGTLRLTAIPVIATDGAIVDWIKLPK